MAIDTSFQKVDSMTKMKMIPLKSIVSDFQQELQNQMAIFNQFLNQKLDEMAIENAKTHAIVREVCNTASPQLHIECGGFTSNDEEVVHTPDLSHNNSNVTTVIGNEEVDIHEQVFCLASETKSIPYLGKITMETEEEGEEAKKKTEKEREVTVRDWMLNSISNLEGFPRKKNYLTNRPESGDLGFRPDPDPEPPDSPQPSVGSPRDLTTVSSSTGKGVGIWTISSIQKSSITRKEESGCDSVGPNPCMGPEMAQGNPSPFASKHRLFLGPLSFLDNPDDVGTTPGQRVNAQNSNNASKEASMKRFAECEDSRVWKTEVLLTSGINRVPAVPQVATYNFRKNPNKGIKPNMSVAKEMDQLSLSVRSIIDQASLLLILIGPRTDCAPYQGVIEDRALVKSEYTSIDLVWVCFGCRDEKDFQNKDFWGAQSQNGKVFSIGKNGGLFGVFSRHPPQKVNDQPMMLEQSAKVGESWSKWAVMDIELNRMTINVVKLVARYFAVKTIPGEEEVIIVKNREGIGVGHESKIKETKYFLDLKEDRKDDVWFWSSIDHSKQGTRLLHQFQVAGLNIWDKNIWIKVNLDEFVCWQNCGSGRLAENHWTPTLVLGGKDHWKLTPKGSTSMAVGRGDNVIGLLQFLYFFYPP
ncbi:hypothetical protein L6452_20682 [Arctium lappa]|uniref:Uncharacterized protein n=1 Tax=Arctium lappa TaxID=4217 RepID=A0ACB9BBJ5_ARCLA|nr:hypothetical protein L6452_20682 [Arctium lappa]